MTTEQDRLLSAKYAKITARDAMLDLLAIITWHVGDPDWTW